MTPNAVTPATSSDGGADSTRPRGGPAAAERRGPGRGSAGGGQVQRRILREDRLLQAPQLGAGLHADLLHERRARLAVGLERLRLPAGSDTARACAGACRRSRSGSCATSASSSPITSACRPASRSASIALSPRADAARRGGGSRRRRTARRPGRRARSPRHSASASRGRRLARCRRSKRTASTSPSGQLQLVAAAMGHDPSAVAVEQRAAGARRRAAPSSARSPAAPRPTSPRRGDRPTPPGPAPARASRAPPAACGGPTRWAVPRGEPRAALGAAVHRGPTLLAAQ